MREVRAMLRETALVAAALAVLAVAACAAGIGAGLVADRPAETVYEAR